MNASCDIESGHRMRCGPACGRSRPKALLPAALALCLALLLSPLGWAEGGAKGGAAPGGNPAAGGAAAPKGQAQRDAPLPALVLARAALSAVVGRPTDTGVTLNLLGRRPDAALAILDVMMPRKDGYETCRCIRSFSTLPVLMLTALGDEAHEIRGMEGGADDYLPKPFSRDLLLAHVRALLRRGKVELPALVEAGGILLDLDARLASRGGEALDPSFREFELLLHLMRNAGAVCPRERILDRVWGYSYSGDPRTLDTHIKSLRRKLGPAGALIVTVRGLGYSFREGGA